MNRNLEMFHSHAKMNFKKLVHFGVFNNPLKYISFYETTWKLAFMVHRDVIEI
jgi:hypothetical protein